MDTTTPSLEQLFAQLGLPNAPHEIRAFILRNRPLHGAVLLHDAAFWNPAQSALIREKLAADADWAVVIDTLNALLRDHPDPSSMPQG
jgi:hypothetical protein